MIAVLSKGRGRTAGCHPNGGWLEGAVLVYLIKGIPLGDGVREACSTVGICGTKVLAFGQLQLDLNSYLFKFKSPGYDIGTKRDERCAILPNKNRKAVYQKQELHANFRTFVLNSIAKANKVLAVQIFVTQAFKR